MKKYILEFSNVSKHFRPTLSYYNLLTLNLQRPLTKALINISFHLEEGKILGILGENGAGKTTLLKIISTLILPDKGDVIVGNFQVGKDDDKIKSIIGFVTCEERSFYERLTGKQNLEFFANLYGLNSKQTRIRLSHLFSVFKIDCSGRRFNTYSTGMKRKFSLIRALLHDPCVILFDEPTKSLDYNSAQELNTFIKGLRNEGKTIILTTHNIEKAENLCDLFMVLHKGRMCGLGTLKDLREKIHSPSANLAEIYLELTQSD